MTRTFFIALVLAGSLGMSGAAVADPTNTNGKVDCTAFFGAKNPGQVAKLFAQGEQGTPGHGVGDDIGGLGNSDGDPNNGQAHSDQGRGALLQEFLSDCGVGSQAP
jgi:hypothetical protein